MSYFRQRPLSSSVATWLPALFLLLACSSDKSTGTTGPPAGEDAVATVTVSPPNATVEVGSTTSLSVSLHSASHKVLTGRSVTWSSSNSSIATVANGVVTGVAAGGPVTIVATSEGKSGSAQITVTSSSTAVPVATVSITPATETITVGGTASFTAVALDAQGSPLTGRTINWSSSTPAVATVAGGLVTGVAPGGPVTITATSEGKSGTAQVTVVPPPPAPVATVTVSPATASVATGNDTPLEATLRDAEGNILSDRVITWSSDNTAVATVADGIVTGIAPGGPVTITATSENKSGTAQITVTGPPVANITITPDEPDVAVGFTIALTATIRDANGNILTDREIDWNSSNGTVATVADGVVAGHNAGGPVVITATSEGQSATAQVTVVAPPAASATNKRIAIQISSGCALGSGGAAWCWGANGAGQLGTGSPGASQKVPVPVTGGHSFVEIATAQTTYCALTASGSAWCWGSNFGGALGNGSAVINSGTPVAVAGGHSFVRLQSSGSHFAMCGIKANGESWCWGSNDGRFGNGTMEDASVPVQTPSGLEVVQAGSGDGAICWLAKDGIVYCSGPGTMNQAMLGNGIPLPQQAAIVATASGRNMKYTSLHVGSSTVCTVRNEAGYCWGRKFDGFHDLVPTQYTAAGMGAVEAVVPSELHTCLLTSSGSAWCWGDGALLGNGNNSNSLFTPLLVSGGHNFVELAVSYNHTCGRTAGGSFYCWGRNSIGQLGDGTMIDRLEPVLVGVP